MKKGSKRLFWWAVLGAAGLAGAQDVSCSAGAASGYPAWVKNGIYSGQIGTLPVTLGIDKDAEQTTYFYRSQGVNLDLTPFRQGDHLILQESGWNAASGDSAPTGCFNLTASGTGLKGEWSTPDGKKRLPVTLTPLNVAALPLQLPPSPGLLKLRHDEPLTFVKLNHPWQTVAGGVKEPYSGVVFPRVAGSTRALNAFLQDAQLGAAAESLDCSTTQAESPAAGDNKWFNLKASLGFQTARLLSLTETGDGFCGGAHPFQIFNVQTVDKQTGTPFKPTDLWPRLTPARLLALYSAKYHAEFDGTEGLQILLTKDGLVIYNDNYPEVNREARTKGVTVPYARLKAEANPRSPYYRDIYGR